jgi:hypothetical protein
MKTSETTSVPLKSPRPCQHEAEHHLRRRIEGGIGLWESHVVPNFVVNYVDAGRHCSGIRAADFPVVVPPYARSK